MQNPSINYNPDVLSCLANLSNDEVFTPSDVANAMLDLLPQEYFSDPNRTFLDPATKSGIFLREIAKRLLKGLEQKIPDIQQRINHIFTKQIFGLGLTELTALLARRSLYCSREANGEFSICDEFTDEQGNIFYQRLQHHWVDGKCAQCGASKTVYDRGDNFESHAYAFIHLPLDKINKNLPMKFDVIIGNPPYQLSDGGAQASAKPIYHQFIQQAKKLNPKYITMIVPSRWYAGGKGLDEFRDEMLSDKRIRELHDFVDATICFPGVDIAGGINYFLWSRDNEGLCKIFNYEDSNNVIVAERFLKEKDIDVFIRQNRSIDILHKVKKLNENTFFELVSSRKPFGLPTNYRGKSKGEIEFYTSAGISYISRNEILTNFDLIDKYKVYTARAYGERINSNFWVTGKPFFGNKGTACSETYLVVGEFDTPQICENVMAYMKTRFFRFLVLLIKNTQDAPRKVYQLVPMQDFSKPWTDQKLYEKYQLTQAEIDYIESMVRPMD